MSAGVYIIRNLANGKVYVGSSVNISARWCKHRIALEAGTHHSIKLQRSWVKYGRDAFAFDIEKNREKRLAAIRPKQHTAESRARMAASQLGNTNRRGCKDSSETRALKSAALKGRPKSEEARRNIIAAIHRRFGKSEINQSGTAGI